MSGGSSVLPRGLSILEPLTFPCGHVRTQVGDLGSWALHTGNANFLIVLEGSEEISNV